MDEVIRYFEYYHPGLWHPFKALDSKPKDESLTACFPETATPLICLLFLEDPDLSPRICRLLKKHFRGNSLLNTLEGVLHDYNLFGGTGQDWRYCPEVAVPRDLVELISDMFEEQTNTKSSLAVVGQRHTVEELVSIVSRDCQRLQPVTRYRLRSFQQRSVPF